MDLGTLGNSIGESILSGLDVVIDVELRLIRKYLVLTNDFPIIIDILNYIVENLIILLRCFSTLFTMRFMLAWFPNINPFIAPYYTVRVATQPYIDFIAKRIPQIFGQDVSFFVCSFLLSYALENLSKIRF
jgi:uncharacterized protein YggT (Ycf19 family)